MNIQGALTGAKRPANPFRVRWGTNMKSANARSNTDLSLLMYIKGYHKPLSGKYRHPRFITLRFIMPHECCLYKWKARPAPQ